MSAGKKLIAPILLALFGIPFVLAGLGVMGWGVHSWMRYRAARSWHPVQATVLEVEFREHAGDETDTYSVDALYEYTFGGRTYQGDGVDIMGGSSSNYGLHRRRYRELDAARKSGRPVTAWVDPEEPSRSLLYREADAWMYAMVPFGFVFAAAGTGIIVLGLVMARRRGKLAEITASDGNRLWHARADWASGQVRASDVKELLVNWGFGVGLSVFLSVFVIMMVSSEAPALAWAVIGLFCFAAAFLLLRALLLTLRHLVHGSPVLYLDEVPVVPGRRVLGAVRTHKPLRAERWRVRMQCYVPNTSDKSAREEREQVTKLVERLEAATGQRRTFRVTNWRGACAYSSDLEPAGDAKTDSTGRTMLPVSIEVPDGAPGSSLDTDLPVTWTLSVKARAFPLSFAASFDLPVFYADEEEIQKRQQP